MGLGFGDKAEGVGLRVPGFVTRGCRALWASKSWPDRERCDESRVLAA